METDDPRGYPHRTRADGSARLKNLTYGNVALCMLHCEKVLTHAFIHVTWRRASPMSQTAVRFRIPLGAGLSEKYHVSPRALNIVTLFQCCVLGH